MVATVSLGALIIVSQGPVAAPFVYTTVRGPKRNRPHVAAGKTLDE